MAATSVSVEGDREFVRRLGVLAAKKQTTIAAVVREAIDAHWGGELLQVASFLVAPSIASTQQSDDKRITQGDEVAS